MTASAWPPAGPRRALRRASLRYRRPVLAALVALAVGGAVGAVAPAPAATRAVVLAASDLGAGHVLRLGDLVLGRYPADLVPDGSYPQLDAVLGRVLAAPLRRAEPVTDAHTAGAAALTGSVGLVEVAVRLADAGAASLVRPGDVVDVVAASSDPGAGGYVADPTSTVLPGDTTPAGVGADGVDGMAAVVASSARVLDVPAPPDSGAGAADGALVVLAVTPTTGRILAAAAARSRLSVLIHAGATLR